MKKALLLFALSIVSLCSIAQGTMIGLSRNEVIETQRNGGKLINLKEDFTSDGMPFIMYDIKGADGMVAFYFERDVCTYYKIITSSKESERLLNSLRENGYVYEKGLWVNFKAGIAALVEREEDKCTATYIPIR